VRISSFHIDGFGIFSDTGASEIAPGINVAIAPNGAGKSTLRAFLCAMLFGFKPRIAKSLKYEPSAAGAHQGELTFLLQNGVSYHLIRPFSKGQETLSRFDAIAPEPLSKLLGSMTWDLYSNVFSIGLDELNGQGQFSSDAVSDAIGGIGSESTGKALKTAREQLEKEAGEIFKPSGRLGINKIFAEIEEMREKLKEMEIEASGYWEIDSRISQLASIKNDFEIKLESVRNELAAAENLLRARPQYERLISLNEELKKLTPKIETFPENGLARMNSLIEAYEKTQMRKAERVQKIDEMSAKSGLLEIDENILAKKEQIDDLHRRASAHENLVRQFQSIRSEISEREKTLNETLEKLGGWTRESLENFDIEQAAGKKRGELSNAILEANAYLTKAEEQHRSSESADQMISTELSDTSAQLLARWPEPPIVEEEIDKRAEMVSQAQSAFQDSETKEARIAIFANQLEELNKQKRTGDEQLKKKNQLTMIGYGLAALLLFIPGAFPHPYGIPGGGANAIRGILFLAFIAAFASINYFSSKNKKEIQKSIDETSNKIREQEKLLMDATAQREAVFGKIEALQEAMGISGLTIDSIDSLKKTIADYRASRKEYEKAQANIASLTERHSEKQSEFEKSKTALETCRSNREGALANWKSWLAELGLRQDLNPIGLEALLDLARDAKQNLQRNNEALEPFKQIQESVLAYRDEANTLLREFGQKEANEELVHFAVFGLYKKANGAANTLQNRQNLLSQIESQRAELTADADELKSIESKISELLAETLSENIEEFQMRADIWQKQIELNTQLASAQNSLEALCDKDESLDQLTQRLSSTDQIQLQDKADSLKAEAAEIFERIGETSKEIGGLGAKRDALASSDQIEQLAQTIENKISEASDLADQWIERKMALWLITKSRDIFQRERQPSVLQHASRSLSAITGGSYSQIYQEIEDGQYRVALSDGRAKSAPWNRGLIDQAFLALRYGIIEDYCERAEPLPVILDDPLVNCDPESAKGAVQQTLALAKNVQVFYFTCHDFVADLFREADPNIAFWTIEDRKIERLP
jgi:uncharacterized protein YhaN